ncbi:MAG: hypothetical protein AAFW46_00175 [Pseudomonadota bacterium]
MSDTNRADAPQPTGLIDRLAAGYRDPAASMRSLLAARPSEGVLLSLLLLGAFMGVVGACLEIFGAAAAVGAQAAGPEAGERFRAQIGTVFVARMLLFPIALYLGAAVLSLLARAGGGSGGAYESRAAMIWAAVLVAPLGLLLSVLDAVGAASGLAALETGGGIAWRAGAAVASLAAASFALYLWASCVAAAHGFRSRLKVAAAGLGVLAAMAAIWIAAASL